MHVPGGLLRPGGQGGRAAEEEGCTCQEDYRGEGGRAAEEEGC